jgi:uncharacterized protein YbbK (DUF523 family)/uncharacterized protein YbgA (DUF1722 family)
MTCFRGGKMNGPVRLGISACLLGREVRYDGGHKLDPFLRDTLGAYVEYVPVCPEHECGLPVPREPMRLAGSPADPRLMTVSGGADHTDQLRSWARKRIETLSGEPVSGYIFKSRSPSCGTAGVPVCGGRGEVRYGAGIWAGMVAARFSLMPVVESERLVDPDILDHFIERVFVFRRWNDTVERERSPEALAIFHEVNRLIILVHNPKACRMLDGIASRGEEGFTEERLEEYVATLAAAMAIAPSARKHVRVLSRAARFLKPYLGEGERRKLDAAIVGYADGELPLTAPIDLIAGHARSFGVPELIGQHYLDPDPVERVFRFAHGGGGISTIPSGR